MKVLINFFIRLFSEGDLQYQVIFKNIVDTNNTYQLESLGMKEQGHKDV